MKRELHIDSDSNSFTEEAYIHYGQVGLGEMPISRRGEVKGLNGPKSEGRKEGRKGSSIVVENDAGNTRIYAHRCREKTHLSALAVADLFARHAAFPRREKSGLFI